MHIHLLGPSGSGTSSLGQSLSKELNIPYFDSDDIFWEKTDPPFTLKRPMEQRKVILTEIDSKYASWIIGWSMLGWGDFIRDKIDLLIYLYVEKDTRISRLIAREKQRFGNRISEGNDMYENHQAFIKWAEVYEDGGMDMRSRKSETVWISEAKCKIIRIEHEISLEDEIKIIKQSLEKFA